LKAKPKTKDRKVKDMKNAFSRMGQTCASTLTKGAIVVSMASAMFAASANPVTVNLPHAVTVGATTLPSGEYTITNVDMSDGNAYFVVRSDRGSVVTLPAQKIDSPAVTSETAVTLQKDGNSWRFDTLSIRGENTSYQFTDQK
jgi:hypothetical protein